MKKNSTKPQTTPRKVFTKNKRISVIVLLLVVAVLIFFAWTTVAARQDAKRFMRVEKDESAVSDRLVTYLGNKVIDVQKKRECFNAGQEPYDNGRLWCQVATVIKLNIDVDYDEVGRELIASIQADKQVSGSSESGGVHRYWYESGEAMVCKLSAIDSRGHEVGSSTWVPFNENDEPAIALSCADEAKAKHYPYVDG